MKKKAIVIFFVICISLLSYFSNKAYTYKSKTTNNTKTTYNSKNLNLTINFPVSWKGKYTISESDNSLSVYFKSKDYKKGLLFTVIKLTDKDKFDHSEYDKIGSNKYININNQKYLVGSTTDIGFPDSHPEYNTYRNMRIQSKRIVDSIKSYKD